MEVKRFFSDLEQNICDFLFKYGTIITRILRGIEILLLVVCVILYRFNVQMHEDWDGRKFCLVSPGRAEPLLGFGNVDTNFIGCGSLMSALLATPLLVIIDLRGKNDFMYKTILEPVIVGVLFILLLSAGISSAATWDTFQLPSDPVYRNHTGLTLASFTIITSIIYLIEVILVTAIYVKRNRVSVMNMQPSPMHHLEGGTKWQLLMSIQLLLSMLNPRNPRR
ncbi:unnamed protein product [Meganyctiphanes norvegica]|uniref:Uncharacterized protein n=1 Tax=Meganyctiphanes norvegica TaxID=48144 RepID=A0AAV2PSG5_MEGNR